MKKLFVSVLAVFVFTGWSATTYLPIHPAPVSADVVTGGLLAWWRFDEGSGTSVADSSGNGKTGTLTGGATFTTSNGSHGAMNFDGANGKMAVSVSSGGTATYSISMWFFPIPSSDSYGAVLTADQSGGFYYRGSTTKADFYFGGDHLNNSAISENSWHHIAIVISAGSGTFYLDGSADGTFSSATDFTFLTMGDDGGSETFKGKISDARIYNRAITSGEVTQLFTHP